MQITLDITPEASVELSRQAAASGKDVETHATTLLEDALDHAHHPARSSIHPEIPFGKRLVEVCAMISNLTEDVEFTRTRSTWRELDLS